MTYSQAWEEYQNNGEAWRTEHDEAMQQVRLEMPEAGSGALVEAGLIMASRPIGQRQEALSRWHDRKRQTSKRITRLPFRTSKS
jgi:hypothetical protein